MIGVGLTGCRRWMETVYARDGIGLRSDVRIDEGWWTVMGDVAGARAVGIDAAAGWETVRLPHNWETYEGYRQLSHGNLHGTAWYRREVEISEVDRGKRVFLLFEGVGSYATVYVNGVEVGKHAGGRTSFEVELTERLNYGGRNVVTVRADHPEKIDDLPYVCGGCWGSPNTEGSQPFGIFRPVRMVTTNAVRIVPHGLHAWAPEIAETRAVLRVNTEVENGWTAAAKVTVRSELLDATGAVAATMESAPATIASGGTKILEATSGAIERPHLWSLDDPYLYRVRSTVVVDGAARDRVEDRFGFRWIQWPVGSIGEDAVEAGARRIDPVKLAEQPGPENGYFGKQGEPLRKGWDAESKSRIVPGGVRVTIPEFSDDAARINIKTMVKNEGTTAPTVIVSSFIYNRDGTKFLYSMESEQTIAPGATATFEQASPVIHFPERWSEENPYLHVVDTRVVELRAGSRRREWKDQLLADRFETTFGIFDASEVEGGLANRGEAFVAEKVKAAQTARDPRFFLNGMPVFINGTAEYEHLLGGDHAFTDEQILTRMKQIKAAGFNMLRMAHHPHNLRYVELCDELGILCWTQIGAHISFDTEPFRENYRTALREWVRERRNYPSIVLWGLQNESSLPTVFARELTEKIRALDPTTSGQRKTCTCNGGTGSDWNIPQNWMGTYGGNALEYGEAIKGQLFVGEYGQWRTLGLHQEGDWLENWKDFTGWERVVSEELFTFNLETKVRLAEEVRDKVCGQIQWIFSTHANPGRSESNSRDGLPPNDVGVVNYKGVISSWGEPVDAYFMYRANYVDAAAEPMVSIGSHTWPDRWEGPGVKNDIVVFSNCEEVELFNDRGGASLGARKRGAKGTHFEWDGVEIRYDTLYAEGRVGGKTVATDTIKLNNLPAAPLQAAAEAADADNTAAAEGAEYVYRVNCGGEDYTDIHGNVWAADRDWTPGGWGTVAWTAAYPDLEPRYASQGRVSDPIGDTRDDALLRTFRYGREELKFRFPVADGEYAVELYFIEPWHGGGGIDARGWRVFDVAVNGEVVLDDLDIFGEAGHDGALKKVVRARAEGGMLEISFPEMKSYQAVVSAIAVRRGE
jgi:hypothetical protein